MHYYTSYIIMYQRGFVMIISKKIQVFFIKKQQDRLKPILPKRDHDFLLEEKRNSTMFSAMKRTIAAAE